MNLICWNQFNELIEPKNMQEFAPEIAGILRIQTKQAIAVLDLLEEGSTIPFIARYRKDRTGALDEVMIQRIQDEAKSLKEFKERKEFIIKTISEQGKMTDSLSAKINKVTTIAELEDIYLSPNEKLRHKLPGNMVSSLLQF